MIFISIIKLSYIRRTQLLSIFYVVKFTGSTKFKINVAESLLAGNSLAGLPLAVRTAGRPTEEKCKSFPTF